MCEEGLTPKRAGMVTPQSLPEGVTLEVRRDSGSRFDVRAVREGHLVGVVSAAPAYSGPCLGAFEVSFSMARLRGLGPLLYDVAMELTGKHGLMSDRRSLSDDGRRVWEYYSKRRSDVEMLQLDSLEDELTPGDKSDNCDQWVSRKGDPSAPSSTWSGSATSRVYRKRGTPIIDELEKLGRIVFL